MGRWGVTGAAGGAVAVTLLMVLSPLAAASGHTYRPPFTGMSSSTSLFQGYSGCGSETITSPLAWNTSTGVMTIAGKTSAKNCGTTAGGVGGSTQAYFDAGVAWGMPIRVTAAPHQVAITMKVSAVISQTFSAPKSCTGSLADTFFYCDVSSDVFIGGYPYLVDTTNGTTFYASNYWQWYNETYNQTEFYNFSGTPTWYNFSGTFSNGGPGTPTWFINTTIALNPRDSYVVVMNFYVDVSSSAYAYGYPSMAVLTGGSATASVNMAGPTNKASLVSIAVT